MLVGLRTVIYPTRDIAAAKAWYAKLLDAEPYFDQPFYVGFSVGGFELGLVPDGEPSTAGVQAYWAVADIDVAFRRTLDLGAKEIEPVTEVGGDIRVASLADPFGNRLGLIQNPHFDPTAVR
ncbi:VOC family protein [Pinirhizobacter sp.]|jgi:predicted enzyme related to lactoylglutathione lyase|uniref:VOC family protein n=1 Tax=Pinirhizobacter sp. TaxID=2950432 RepID=UPI002F3ED4C3